MDDTNPPIKLILASDWFKEKREGQLNDLGVRCPYCNHLLIFTRIQGWFGCSCNPILCFHRNYLLAHLPTGLDSFLSTPPKHNPPIKKSNIKPSNKNPQKLDSFFNLPSI